MAPAQRAELVRRHSVRRLQRRRPSVMLCSGFPPPVVFRQDRLSLAIQLLAVLADARHIAWLDGAGATGRDHLVRMLSGTGLPRWLLAAAVRDSFESQHGIQGFPDAPSYHLLRGASFERRWTCSYLRPAAGATETDPYAEDEERWRVAVRRAAGARDGAAAAGDDAAGAGGPGPVPGAASSVDAAAAARQLSHVRVDRSAWARIRRRAPPQLRSLARALLDCGIYDDTADMLAAALLMLLNAPSWGGARRVALRIKQDLDGASQPPSVLLLPAELPAELGTGADARASLRSHASRRIAEAARSKERIRLPVDDPGASEGAPAAAEATRRALAKAAALGMPPLVEGHAAWSLSTAQAPDAGSSRADRIRLRTEAMQQGGWGPTIDDAEEAAQVAAALAGLWIVRLQSAAEAGAEAVRAVGDADPRWVVSRLPGGAASRGSVSPGGVFIPLPSAGAAAAAALDKDPARHGEDRSDPAAEARRRAAAASLEAVLPRMPTQRREDVWPPAVAQRLATLYELVTQLDRIVGPAHPACLQVQAAWAEAQALAPSLVRMEEARHIAVRRLLDAARR